MAPPLDEERPEGSDVEVDAGGHGAEAEVEEASNAEHVEEAMLRHLRWMTFA